MTTLRLCSPHCGVAPETTSGGETYEREILVRLGRAGVRVELVLARGKPHPPDAPNWRVHRFAIGRGLRWWVAPLVVPPAIARVHRQAPFDLLRVHSLRYIGPSALWARRRYGLDVPLVAHHHHVDPGPLSFVIERRVSDRCDAVVVGSEFARRQLAALGARSDHVTVVPYGVDDRFAPRGRPAALAARYGIGDRPVVLFLGGLKPRKNLPLVLDVWPRVLTQQPRARLVIAGGGRLLSALRRRADALGVSETVVFTGYVAEADKAEHFNLADVFLFPSAMEGFGLAVAEAMSSGLPCVASNRGSIPELFEDGEGGFLRDPADVDGFVEGVCRLLGDASLRAKLGAANAERVDRRFRWQTCVDATLRVYEAVVEGWRAAGHRRR